MLIEKLNMERIPESHNKIKKNGTTFGYNLACAKMFVVNINNPINKNILALAYVFCFFITLKVNFTIIIYPPLKRLT